MIDINIKLFIQHPINLHISMKLPIKRLLVSINQSNSGCLKYLWYKLFNRAKEANIYAIKSMRLRSQILNFRYFSNFIFKENQVFNQEENHSRKVVIDEKELDDTDIDDIENLPRIYLGLCSTMSNVEIQKWSMAESLLEVSNKRRIQTC